MRLFETAGILQTKSARERNLPNIMSYLCLPLETTRGVLDKSQSIKCRVSRQEQGNHSELMVMLRKLREICWQADTVPEGRIPSNLGDQIFSTCGRTRP